MYRNILIVILIVISLLLAAQLFKVKEEAPQQKTENTIEKTVIDDKTEVSAKDSQNSITANRLDLSNQRLEKLPSDVLSKTNLEELDISNNNLSGALPAEIRQLQNLKVLNASNNNMTGVPAEIGQLKKLEVLDLSNNQLTGLPYELGNLKNLKTLILSGNNYAQQDLDVIKSSLPETTEIIL